MKRDMELIRLLLLETESGETPPELCSYLEEDIFYNYELMTDAGLIVASFNKDSSGKIIGSTVRRLTWAGHDFLDSTRDSKLWKAAKEHLIKPGVSWTFSILTEWLKQQARQRFLPIPSSYSDETPPAAV